MLAVVWLGFCFGMVICMAIIKLGSKGIVLIVTALAPQGNLLCNGRDRVIPLYAGISNGEMGCGKKYPAWPVPDAWDHYRVLCKSGTYRLVFEDTVNIQKCRIKETDTMEKYVLYHVSVLFCAENQLIFAGVYR